MSDDPIHTETEDLHETHVTHFQLTTTESEVFLSGGELKTDITENGNSEISKVIYDTKLRMTHKTAYDLLRLLKETFERSETDN